MHQKAIYLSRVIICFIYMQTIRKSAALKQPNPNDILNPHMAVDHISKEDEDSGPIIEIGILPMEGGHMNADHCIICLYALLQK